MSGRVLPILSVLALSLLACRAPQLPTAAPPSATARATAAPTQTLTTTPSPTFSPSPTATHSATPRPTPTASATPTPTSIATPDPYAGLTIADLTARSYGGGEVTVAQMMVVTAAYTRTLINFPSDGLTIYGFMNVPRGRGPFPVVIMLHGYIDPAAYSTLDYTTRYADALAEAGYLVLHPNLRGYPPSDSGPNRFRVGMAVDVLNLMAIVQQRGGQPGSLQQADRQAIGLWGHSMGGGITWRVLAVSQKVRAAVLYAAMNADERKNLEQMVIWRRERGGPGGGVQDLETPDEDVRRLSPASHLELITAAISIHHSAADPTVPPEWSRDACLRLGEMGTTVECFTYPGLPHTFRGAGDRLFILRTIAFYDRYLKGGGRP